jgi:hypothetical protein
MNGDGNAFQYIPGLRHPDPAHECTSHSGGETQSPGTAWPDTEQADEGDSPTGGRDPGDPTLSGVLDGGLARLTVTQGVPPVRSERHHWDLEGSFDNVAFFPLGSYPISGAATDEVDIASILGPYWRIRWHNYVTDTYGNYSNTVHLT